MYTKLVPILMVFLLNLTFGELKIDQKVLLSINPLMNQDYDSARSYLEQLLILEPGNIDAVFMHFNILATELLDYESYSINSEASIQIADSLLKIIEKQLETSVGEAHTRYLFYTANIYGFIGLVQAKTSGVLSSVKNGMISIRLFRDVLNADSTIYDALLGIGMYDYYIGQNLRWLPFMGSKARGGIENIERAANAVSPFSYGAKYNLCWALIDKNHFDRADAVVSSVLETYPDNTLFVGTQAHIALLQKNYDKAIKNGGKLIILSERCSPINWCNVLSGYKIVIASLYEKQRYEKSLSYVNRALNLSVPESSKKISYVKKHLEYITKLKKKITSNLK